MIAKGGLEDIRKRVRGKMLRKILSPEMEDGEVRRDLRMNVHKTDGVVELTKKKKLQFYDHMLEWTKTSRQKESTGFLFRLRKSEHKFFRDGRIVWPRWD